MYIGYQQSVFVNNTEEENINTMSSNNIKLTPQNTLAGMLRSAMKSGPANTEIIDVLNTVQEEKWITCLHLNRSYKVPPVYIHEIRRNKTVN